MRNYEFIKGYGCFESDFYFSFKEKLLSSFETDKENMLSNHFITIPCEHSKKEETSFDFLSLDKNQEFLLSYGEISLNDSEHSIEFETALEQNVMDIIEKTDIYKTILEHFSSISKDDKRFGAETMYKSVLFSSNKPRVIKISKYYGGWSENVK